MDDPVAESTLSTEKSIASGAPLVSNTPPTLVTNIRVVAEKARAAVAAGQVRIAERYGPGALLTPANFITVLRLLLSPVLLVMIVKEPTSWAAAAFWTVLALTDGIDGHLARKHGTTRSGAFLDPLADKVLVLGALFALVAAGRFWIVPVGIIAVREVGISIYRTQLGRQGLAVPARTLGKIKTVVQEFAVALALFPITGDYRMAAVATLWVAVAFTWISGAQYLFDGRGAATRLGHRTAAA